MRDFRERQANQRFDDHSEGAAVRIRPTKRHRLNLVYAPDFSGMCRIIVFRGKGASHALARSGRYNKEVPYHPAGLIHQGALQETVDRAKSALGSEVWHVAYRIGEDNTGAPSIFFRITMQDFAMTEGTVSESTGLVATALFDHIRPLENWGLRPYFNFRSVSDQQKRPDPDWL